MPSPAVTCPEHLKRVTNTPHDECETDDEYHCDAEDSEDYPLGEVTLRVGQLNLAGRHGISDARLLNLMEHQAWAATARPEDFLNIIVVQDVPQRLAFKSWTTHRACYDSTEPLQEADHPRYLNKVCPQQQMPHTEQHTKKKASRRRNFIPLPSEKRKVVRLPRVAFLISNDIDPSCYVVKAHSGPNKDLAATLTLETDIGHLEIHNVYNPERMNTDEVRREIDIDSLGDTVCPAPQDKARLSMVVGDFNLHHVNWMPHYQQRVNPRANYFEKKMDAYKMQLITKCGVPTWRSRDPKTGQYHHWSTIDLMFASQVLAPHVPKDKWRTIEVKGLESDHCLISATIVTRPRLLLAHRFCWNLDNATCRALQKGVTQSFSKLSTDDILRDEASTEEYAVRCCNALTTPATQCVPVLHPLTHRTCSPRTGFDQARLHAPRNFVPSTRRSRTRRFRRFLANIDLNRLYRVSRGSAKWRKPRLLPHMPRLLKEREGALEHVPRGYDEGDHFFRTIHGPQTGSLRKSSPPHMPDESLLENFDESERKLGPKEVYTIVKGLKKHKAVGVGIVANEALITCVDIICKHLEHLFEACLRLSYHPKIFKDSRTIAIPKPDKSSYAYPKSWRPITLLGALSKVLDKLVTDRLTKFALRTGCLPANQFGISGKSTTNALQFLLNEVYAGWTVGQMVTLLSLDITGAYPRVNRDRLLEALARKKVPNWIVRFVFSWLLDTHTDLHLPGRRPESFCVNLGIPQGSSLSPILFLFFASGLLEIDLRGSGAMHACLFSYVDDSYILVRSGSFETNRKALPILHDRAQAWANANDVEFAPNKYGLLHFQRGSPKDRCRLLPPIQGLTLKHLEAPEGYNVPHLRILGVMVDTQLKWGPHIDFIEEKVKTQRYNFWHISRTQSGPTLKHMRQLYMAKVLPIFAYACGAWYFPKSKCTKFGLNKSFMDRLESLQRQCLLDVSGGMSRTTSEALWKELNIHRMPIFLWKTAIAQRARDLDTPQHAEMCRMRARVSRKRKTSPEENHPYHQLDNFARELLDDALRPRAGDLDVNVKRCIKCLANKRAHEESRAAWESHKVDYISRHSGRIPTAYSERKGWGPHNLTQYEKLPRKQSSVLFQCRVEAAPVKATLYRMRLEKDNEDRTKDTPCCPCGYWRQTIEHLFSYCPDLEEARATELVLKLGTKHVDELLTRYPAQASAFAVRHFNICKYNADDELYLPQTDGGKGERSAKSSKGGKQQRRGHDKQEAGKSGKQTSGKGGKQASSNFKKTKCQQRSEIGQEKLKKKRREAAD